MAKRLAEEPQAEGPNVLDFRDRLSINPDNLNEGLEEQSGLYYDVANAYAEAVAQRDAIKLDLEEKSAEIDQATRKKAEAEEAKITEAGVQQAIRMHKDIQALQRTFLDAKAAADSWGAMKEAFQQRSFMLREIVQLTLAQLHNLGLERGVQGAKVEMSDVNRFRAGQMRRDAAGRRRVTGE